MEDEGELEVYQFPAPAKRLCKKLPQAQDNIQADYYPQRAGQPEDILNPETLSKGFQFSAPVRNELVGTAIDKAVAAAKMRRYLDGKTEDTKQPISVHASLRPVVESNVNKILRLREQKIAQSTNQTIAQHSLQSQGRAGSEARGQNVTPKYGDARASVLLDKRTLEKWVMGFERATPLKELANKIPIFKKEWHVANSLLDLLYARHIPVIRAVWLIKITFVHELSLKHGTKKKESYTLLREWTTVITSYLADKLPIIAPQENLTHVKSQAIADALGRFRYGIALMIQMLSDGMMDKPMTVSWMMDHFKKSRTNTEMSLILTTICQLWDQFLDHTALTRTFVETMIDKYKSLASPPTSGSASSKNSRNVKTKNDNGDRIQTTPGSNLQDAISETIESLVLRTLVNCPNAFISLPHMQLDIVGSMLQNQNVKTSSLSGYVHLQKTLQAIRNSTQDLKSLSMRELVSEHPAADPSTTPSDKKGSNGTNGMDVEGAGDDVTDVTWEGDLLLLGQQVQMDDLYQLIFGVGASTEDTETEGPFSPERAIFFLLEWCVSAPDSASQVRMGMLMNLLTAPETKDTTSTEREGNGVGADAMDVDTTHTSMAEEDLLGFASRKKSVKSQGEEHVTKEAPPGIRKHIQSVLHQYTMCWVEKWSQSGAIHSDEGGSPGHEAFNRESHNLQMLLCTAVTLGFFDVMAAVRSLIENGQIVRRENLSLYLKAIAQCPIEDGNTRNMLNVLISRVNDPSLCRLYPYTQEQKLLQKNLLVTLTTLFLPNLAVKPSWQSTFVLGQGERIYLSSADLIQGQQTTPTDADGIEVQVLKTLRGLDTRLRSLTLRWLISQLCMTCPNRRFQRELCSFDTFLCCVDTCPESKDGGAVLGGLTPERFLLLVEWLHHFGMVHQAFKMTVTVLLSSRNLGDLLITACIAVGSHFSHLNTLPQSLQIQIFEAVSNAVDTTVVGYLKTIFEGMLARMYRNCHCLATAYPDFKDTADRLMSFMVDADMFAMAQRWTANRRPGFLAKEVNQGFGQNDRRLHDIKEDDDIYSFILTLFEYCQDHDLITASGRESDEFEGVLLPVRVQGATEAIKTFSHVLFVVSNKLNLKLPYKPGLRSFIEIEKLMRTGKYKPQYLDSSVCLALMLLAKQYCPLHQFIEQQCMPYIEFLATGKFTADDLVFLTFMLRILSAIFPGDGTKLDQGPNTGRPISDYLGFQDRNLLRNCANHMQSAVLFEMLLALLPLAEAMSDIPEAQGMRQVCENILLSPKVQMDLMEDNQRTRILQRLRDESNGGHLKHSDGRWILHRLYHDRKDAQRLSERAIADQKDLATLVADILPITTLSTLPEVAAELSAAFQEFLIHQQQSKDATNAGVDILSDIVWLLISQAQFVTVSPQTYDRQVARFAVAMPSDVIQNVLTKALEKMAEFDATSTGFAASFQTEVLQDYPPANAFTRLQLGAPSIQDDTKSDGSMSEKHKQLQAERCFISVMAACMVRHGETVRESFAMLLEEQVSQLCDSFDTSIDTTEDMLHRLQALQQRGRLLIASNHPDSIATSMAWQWILLLLKTLRSPLLQAAHTKIYQYSAHVFEGCLKELSSGQGRTDANVQQNGDAGDQNPVSTSTNQECEDTIKLVVQLLILYITAICSPFAQNSENDQASNAGSNKPTPRGGSTGNEHSGHTLSREQQQLIKLIIPQIKRLPLHIAAMIETAIPTLRPRQMVWVPNESGTSSAPTKSGSLRNSINGISHAKAKRKGSTAGMPIEDGDSNDAAQAADRDDGDVLRIQEYFIKPWDLLEGQRQILPMGWHWFGWERFNTDGDCGVQRGTVQAMRQLCVQHSHQIMPGDAIDIQSLGEALKAANIPALGAFGNPMIGQGGFMASGMDNANAGGYSSPLNPSGISASSPGILLHVPSAQTQVSQVENVGGPLAATPTVVAKTATAQPSSTLASTPGGSPPTTISEAVAAAAAAAAAAAGTTGGGLRDSTATVTSTSSTGSAKKGSRGRGTKRRR
eukprot:Clim_evm88s108 gene=Clim_evmTU88s108